MSGRILRVEWVPGSDRLSGRCHCGASAEAEDPILLWEWLLAHPDHPPGGDVVAAPTPSPSQSSSLSLSSRSAPWAFASASTGG